MRCAAWSQRMLNAVLYDCLKTQIRMLLFCMMLRCLLRLLASQVCGLFTIATFPMVCRQEVG